MPPHPTKLRSERTMLRLAREGSTEDKLALLDNQRLSHEAERILVFEGEPEVQEEAVQRCINVEWLQELATRGPAPALRGLIQNQTFLPVEGGPHPRRLFPWHYQPTVHPWDRYRPDRSGFRHLLFLTGVVQVEEDLFAEYERLQALDLDADEALRHECEAALMAFYRDLMHRMAQNPALTGMGEYLLRTYFTWWFRLPGDHLEEALRLLDWEDPAVAQAMASSWATSRPILERLLEQAYTRDDVELRQALTWWASGRLCEQDQARLWADPDPRVRGWVLNYGLAPVEVMLRLARDPEIGVEHLPRAPKGGLLYEASTYYGEEFERVIWERFGLTVDRYVH